MKKYIYQNTLVNKRQLRQLLSWTFTNYDSIQASRLADELKYLGFKYSSQAGISISIEDLKIPFIKNFMLKKANQEIINTEKLYFQGKMTDIERFQKIIDTWNLTSESLKEQVVKYFKNYDPLNSVYIMAFSGARGNLSQVRQLVGMRGLMSDTSGEIMNLAIKKNFREGLTITDYLMSGYGARKGIIDTSLKTANSGYLTRRLIDVAQDILIREKNCLTTDSFLFVSSSYKLKKKSLIYEKIVGRVLSKDIIDIKTKNLIAKKDSIITKNLIEKFQEKQIEEFYIRSPLTCNLYRAICQKCYGWDLANENLIDMGEAIGILAGQSIGEPGTQLTMRTFHTGGIFTSQAREQILSPINGIVKFYKLLKTVVLRSNRGEDVSITKNSGSIILIPESKTQNLVKIEVLKNTILFPKNNQYILKNTVIAEVINKNRQIRTEIKPILNDTDGEIFMPRLKQNIDLLNTNKLIWILSGQLYNSPNNSFINFYPDYKINSSSYIFRTKIINKSDGFIEFTNKKQNLYQRVIRIKNNKYLINNANLQKLKKKVNSKNYLLNLTNFKYLLNIQSISNRSEFYLQIASNKQIGILLTNSFRTFTGGIVYYNYKNVSKSNNTNHSIQYIDSKIKESIKEPIISCKTIIWLGEESYQVNSDSNLLFVDHGAVISSKFELIPNLFSKTSGSVVLTQKNNMIQTILIKSGVVYEIKKLKDNSNKIYYPGELIFSTLYIKELSFCEYIVGEDVDQLIIRPIELFEFPYSHKNHINMPNKLNLNTNSNFEIKSIYTYESNQKIKNCETKNLNLVSQFLILKSETKFINQNLKIEVVNNLNLNSINLLVSEKLNLNNYIAPNLKYKNLQSCILVQPHQFIDKYTLLAYLESLAIDSLQIIKFKIKTKYSKQILLISNHDCLIVEKNKFPNKKVNDFIIDSMKVNEIGKIIIENNYFFTLQKGRPYFFPNCRNENLTDIKNVQYKVIPNRYFDFKSKINQNICVNYYNLMTLSSTKTFSYKENKLSVKVKRKKATAKKEFRKLFFKKSGKLYSSLMFKLFKKFSINNSKSNLNNIPLFKTKKSSDKARKKKVENQTLLLQSSDKAKNKYKDNNIINSQLTLVKFTEPHKNLKKTNKAIGLYSITEDYFEQEVNSVFCKNTQFIENGETIGLLNLEKEITGDIVQGLPKVEEILEARKKKAKITRIPTSQKKGLVIQRTSLDPNFEFRKLGTSIQENNKINLHKLLKVYFNYYGLMKSFVCDKSKIVKYNRLIENYEGSYKSFKKIQLFILNSVQSVYDSQGVFINDKHLELIIKQMTTKVLITYEGNTPLLPREVIDLYHIKCINHTLKKLTLRRFVPLFLVHKIHKSNIKFPKPAHYVPFLLGISRTALNNPSFMSAASFQETTQVLKKAAIEGRIDWLRGLKENIIIGHLIPAGTGSTNYCNSFKKKIPNKKKVDYILNKKNNE